MCQTWQQAAQQAEAVLFLAGHDEFNQINIVELAEVTNENALIFDGRSLFNAEKIVQIKQHQLNYLSIGQCVQQNKPINAGAQL